MNQDKTIVGDDESVAVDAELLPRERNEKKKKRQEIVSSQFTFVIPSIDASSTS